MSESKIIERMRKLLALTESGNEHEAMSATRKLHSMLAKHNISMDSLNEQEDSVGSSSELVSCKPWKIVIAMKIAKLYFCSFYFAAGSKKNTYVFVGTESNRTFALHIFNMVVKTVEVKSRKESKEVRGKRDSKFINSFRSGAANRVSARCEEMIESAKAGTMEDEEGNTLPMLLDIYESHRINIESWLEANANLKSIRNRLATNDSKGFERGQVTGDNVQLNRAIQSKQAPKLLGGN